MASTFQMVGKMGDRAERQSAPKRQRPAESTTRQVAVGRPSKRARGAAGGVFDIQNFGAYQPTSRETEAVYNEMLKLLTARLGDADTDTLTGAVDDALYILKDDSKKTVDKKRPLELMLGGGALSDELFTQLINLSNKITDFTTNAFTDGGEAGINADQGVSVIIEDEEDEEGDTQMHISTRDDRDEEGDDDDEGVETGVGRQLQATGKEEEEEADEFQLDARKIDAYWIQREMGTLTENEEAHETQDRAERILASLSNNSLDLAEIEKQLLLLFNYENFDFIRTVCKNRWKLVYCTRLARAGEEDERKRIRDEMAADKDLAPILEELEGGGAKQQQSSESREFRKHLREAAQQAKADAATGKSGAEAEGRSDVDLEALAFQEGSHFMSNKTCVLPKGSHRVTHKEWDELIIPAPAKRYDPDRKTIKIKEMPEWAQPAFEGFKELNVVQSEMYEIALSKPEENILLCAPTGAGKTNVAMLTLLAELEKHIKDGELDLEDWKVVYIAPMKALVQEVVHNFGERLKAYGIKVGELTGDVQMTKAQIAETQMIVTTPEKWDVVTRKSGERAYTQQVRLIIIDEIHLLHDDRGPVLESVVARTRRQGEETREVTRLVGLSATLPNYDDVAAFLDVKPREKGGGLFVFDSSYRPVPLATRFIGIKSKKPLKKLLAMNDCTYNLVAERAGKNQMLVFVHSRKETAKTARYIRDTAIQGDTIGRFLKEDSGSRAILAEEANNVISQDLKDLLPFGFAIHHAGMERTDRTLVEDLFRDKHIQVLVSTATLAWGVNLPARTVIIKGTQIYSPEKGRWTELSPLDVVQMMGRAGRPQFDKEGEGIIMTSHAELQFYLSLMNTQLPVESQMISKLPDQLNAEVVLGTVQSVEDAVKWLGYSYLYVRMLRSPQLYGTSAGDVADDETLERYRADLIHTAASLLDRHNLVRYDRRTGALQTTDLGRVASHYYIAHQSIATYNDNLKPSLSDIEIFRVFALSNEFANIGVRQEERLELQNLLERVPVPVKETVNEPTAKMNVLLQAYISELALTGFALMADMVYIAQSAGRIFRALHEIALRRHWAQLASKLLDVAKMVDRRMWLSQNPLRQFKGVPIEIVQKLERKDIPWDRYYDLAPAELGELLRNPKVARNLYKFIHQLPRLELQAHVQPITRAMLRIELTITPDFQWDVKQHGTAQQFWIICEDVDQEVILHYEQFVLKERFVKDEHFVFFTVPIQDPLPPHYFVRVVSDRWMWSETVLSLSFQKLILPEKYPPETDLLELQPMPLSALRNQRYQELYEFSSFNPIQTQTFHTLYNTDDNTFICAPPGSGKSVCLELALLRFLTTYPKGYRCVYVAAHEDICARRYAEWKKSIEEKLGRRVEQLTGEMSVDVKLLEQAEVIISTPENWDLISRRWRQRKNVQNVRLFLVDEMHLIGGPRGPVLEIVTSRMRYISAQLEQPGQQQAKVRIVAVSNSLANARDLAEWLGAGHTSTFNFHPRVRPVPLEIHLQGFDQSNFVGRQMAMIKPTYTALRTHADGKQAIIFVPEKRYVYQLASDLISYSGADEPKESPFVGTDPADFAPHLRLVTDEMLKHVLQYGIAFQHEATGAREATVAQKLFAAGAARVMIVTYQQVWSVQAAAHCVIVMGTEHFDGREHRHVDYQIADVLQMMGSARIAAGGVAKCVFFCQMAKREYYKRFLYDPLPIESHLDHFLADHINAEIVTKTIETKQDAVDYITWTFLWRRLRQNPNFYHLQGTTPAHLSDYVSELVETTLTALEESKSIAIDEEDNLQSLNLGMIAAFYYIQYTTIETFSAALGTEPFQMAMAQKHGSQERLLGLLLEILSVASEFGQIIVRHREDKVVQKLSQHCPYKLEGSPRWSDPHTKVHVLLQCHFGRKVLPYDLDTDTKKVLEQSIPLIQALVDVIASNRWIKPALAAMKLSQMIVQGLWGDSERDAEGVQKYIEENAPGVDVDAAVLDADAIHAGGMMGLNVRIQRDRDYAPARAPFFPKVKEEGWWIVVGEVGDNSNALHAIKRTTVNSRSTSVKVNFAAPVTEGETKLRVYLVSDCYTGIDKTFEVSIDVKEALMDEDEE